MTDEAQSVPAVIAGTWRRAWGNAPRFSDIGRRCDGGVWGRRRCVRPRQYDESGSRYSRGRRARRGRFEQGRSPANRSSSCGEGSRCLSLTGPHRWSRTPPVPKTGRAPEQSQLHSEPATALFQKLASLHRAQIFGSSRDLHPFGLHPQLFSQPRSGQSGA